MTSILVVDDDDSLRTAVLRELTHRGYAASGAESADRAIDLIHVAQPDVLLADLNMPGRDGIDLLQATQSIAPHTRSILMSAFASARDYESAMARGAVRVLTKPFTSDELVGAIGHAVDCESGFRGNLHGLSLIDVLQMYHLARRSVAVSIRGRASGTVYFVRGEAVHAEAGDLRGEAALQVLLAHPSGSLFTHSLATEPPTTIQRPFESLLLDLLREMDEAGQSNASLDDFQFDLVADAPAAPAPDSAARAWLDQVRTSLARIDPDCHAASIAVNTGAIEVLQRGPFDALWAAYATEMAGVLARLSPGWNRYECVYGSHAMALLRGPDDTIVVLSRVLAERYAQLKFRAVLGRLNTSESPVSAGGGQ